MITLTTDRGEAWYVDPLKITGLWPCDIAGIKTWVRFDGDTWGSQQDVESIKAQIDAARATGS